MQFCSHVPICYDSVCFVEDLPDVNVPYEGLFDGEEGPSRAAMVCAESPLELFSFFPSTQDVGAHCKREQPLPRSDDQRSGRETPGEAESEAGQISEPHSRNKEGHPKASARPSARATVRACAYDWCAGGKNALPPSRPVVKALVSHANRSCAARDVRRVHLKK